MIIDNELLQRLYSENQIEKLLQITKNSDDIDARFYHLAGLRKIGDFQIALSYIIEHQMDLYVHNAPRLIEWHIDILQELNEFDQALNTLRQYESFPYFSLETNELIAKLGEKIQNKRKLLATARIYDLKELDRRLFSGNQDLIVSALQYIFKHYHESYISLLQKVLLTATSEQSKAQVIILLKEKGYNKLVEVHKFGKNMKVNPTSVLLPLTSKAEQHIQEAITTIAHDDHDVNMANVINNIFTDFALFYYPLKFENKDVEMLSQVFKYISLIYMGRIEKNLTLFASLNNIDLDTMVAIMNKYHFGYHDLSGTDN